MTTVGKATAETEAVHKKDSAKETDTDDGSGETKEVDLTETEAKKILKRKETQIVGLLKQRRLI